MELTIAYKKAKALNLINKNLVASVVYKNYSGYSVQTETYESVLLRNSLSLLSSQNRNFQSNVSLKYGK